MDDAVATRETSIASLSEISPAGVLGAVSFPVMVLDRSNRIVFLNAAAESFFEHGALVMTGQALDRFIAEDSPVHGLIAQARDNGVNISEHDIDLVLQRGGARGVSLHASPYGESGGAVVLSIHAHGAARHMERQLFHRSAARSVTAMATMLAHEIKNPLSGIRGAAQLLERAVTGQDQMLARLIRDETDRINALVDEMGVFASDGPPDRTAVNIHEVLERVQQSAASGFAETHVIRTAYDPSLPPVFANRDQLIQVFLNLVKNASEAVPEEGGEISISTEFHRGMRLTIPGHAGHVQLPLMVTIADNGSGISDDIAKHLFDPFVTTKSGGSGLGLALVAKIINDHGGLVEFDSGEAGTKFRVFLPVVDAPVTSQNGINE
jgi:two-component system, NtrC family, nitrogen regulation sensor histidine kinase GlnL